MVEDKVHLAVAGELAFVTLLVFLMRNRVQDDLLRVLPTLLVVVCLIPSLTFSPVPRAQRQAALTSFQLEPTPAPAGLIGLKANDLWQFDPRESVGQAVWIPAIAVRSAATDEVQSFARWAIVESLLTLGVRLQI